MMSLIFYISPALTKYFHCLKLILLPEINTETK